VEIDILNRDYKDDDPDVWNLVYNKAYQNKIIGSHCRQASEIPGSVQRPPLSYWIS